MTVSIPLKCVARGWCRLVGCRLHDNYPACARCGGALYYDLIDAGWLEPMLRAYWHYRDWLRRKLRIHKCYECGRRIIPGTAYKEDFCDERCFDNWIPF